LIDATISELKLEVEDGDGLFGSVLKAVGSSSIAVDSAHRRTFARICPALCNSELYRSVYDELGDEVTMEDVVDRLRFWSATRCDISAELEFIRSHFCDFLPRPDALNALPFSLIYEILSHRSVRLDSEDSLYDFISKGSKTNSEMLRLLEFVKMEYCSTDVMSEFFDLLSGHCYEINASMWAGLRARLVLPTIGKKRAKQFPPLVKMARVGSVRGRVGITINLPDGIIAHLTRECGGDMHDCHVVDITCGSFDKETCGPIHTRGHVITRIGLLQRMLLIWKLIHISCHLFAPIGKIFRTRGIIGCATISGRGGLRQLTTQSARIIMRHTNLI
jgi:hypothetical protein